MSNGLVRLSDEHEDPAIKTIEFILKLARDPCAENDDDVRNGNISAIVTQLDLMHQNPFFPEALKILDPSQHYSQTKLLPDYAKDILRRSLDNYCGK